MPHGGFQQSAAEEFFAVVKFWRSRLVMEFWHEPWLSTRLALRIPNFVPDNAIQPMAKESPASLISELWQDAQKL
jgi:hypothetical protein